MIKIHRYKILRKLNFISSYFTNSYQMKLFVELYLNVLLFYDVIQKIGATLFFLTKFTF